MAISCQETCKKTAGQIRNFFALTQATTVTLRQAEARMTVNTLGTPAKANTNTINFIYKY
jgi:hypothetical protein